MKERWRQQFGTGASSAGRRCRTPGPPCAAVIDHTLASLAGHTRFLIEPASALPALELTLDVHQRLNQAAR